MANCSPAPTPEALLGATYKIRHLCNTTLSALPFGHFLPLISVRLFTGEQRPTPCRANTKDKVIWTNYASQCFLQSTCWCLIIGWPGKLRACGLGIKRFRKPVSLSGLGGDSGQGNTDSWLQRIWILGLRWESVLFMLGMSQGRVSLQKWRDVALGFGAFPRLVKCHSLIPSFSRGLWNTWDAELGKRWVKGRQHPRSCPRRWKVDSLWPWTGRMVLLRLVTEILIRLRTFWVCVPYLSFSNMTSGTLLTSLCFRCW